VSVTVLPDSVGADRSTLMLQVPLASSVLPRHPFGSVIAKYLCDVTTISSILPPADEPMVTVS